MSARVNWSLHTHSRYCDGEGALDEVAAAALDLGLTDLGFSSHAPLPFKTSWNMAIGDLDRYQSEILELRERHAGRLRIHTGLELDFEPSAETTAFQAAKIIPRGFDYFVGSVHFLGRGYPPLEIDGHQEKFGRILQASFDGDIRTMAASYYSRVAESAARPGIGIVGHFDLIKRWNHGNRYFDDRDDWYRQMVDECLRSIAATEAAVELNTAGWRKGLGEQYPATWILARCRDLGIPVTVSADSHTPGDLTRDYIRAADLLASLGIEPVNPLAA